MSRVGMLLAYAAGSLLYLAGNEPYEGCPLMLGNLKATITSSRCLFGLRVR